jgi:hypothetical protein
MTFHQVPVVVFELFHSYLSHYEYRQLLNCNRSFFTSIKYETVYYDLKAVNDWSDQSCKSGTSYISLDKEIKIVCELIKRNVKHREKQIGMKYCCESLEQLDLVSSLFKGVHSLEVTFSLPDVAEYIPFKYFRNVYQLTLDGFYNFTLKGLSGKDELELAKTEEDMSNGSMNINILELKNNHNLNDISEVAFIPTVKKVSILNCPCLRELSWLRDIEEVEILGFCGFENELFCLGGKNQRTFNFSSSFMEGNPISSLSQFRHLNNLSFDAKFENSCNFHVIFLGGGTNDCTIRKLNVTNRSFFDSVIEMADTLPLFPQIPSISCLSLFGFNLSSWVDPSASASLSSVVLMNCEVPFFTSFRFISHLTISCDDTTTWDFSKTFENLRHLKIVECGALETLIIGSNIKKVEIVGCEVLKSISDIGKVNWLIVSRCYELEIMEGLIGANFVRLKDLIDLEDFSFLEKVYKDITIIHCPKFQNIGKFDRNVKITIVTDV